jgi:PhnB protein
MRAQMSEPKDQRYPERNAGVIDAWGNHWYIATHQEDLTAEELRVRTAAQGESIQ